MTKGRGQPLGSIFGTGPRPTAVPSRPAAALPSTPPGVAAFLAVMDRLESVLDGETEALKGRLPTDMADIGNRKRQGLLEMNRALRAAASDRSRPEVRERLKRFSVAVERNRAALGTQLLAVREIAEIIAQSMRDAESDGTYSAMAGRA